MKIVFVRTVLTLTFILQANCLVTDKLGFLDPLGSVSAEEAVGRIQQTASVSFLLGVFGFCSQFDPPDTCMSAYSGSMGVGLLLSRTLIAARLNLDPDKNYIASTVVDCQKKFNVLMNLMTVSHLNGKKQCNFFTCFRAPEGEVESAALVNTLVASQLCEIQETGNILSIYRYNLDLPFLPDLW